MKALYALESFAVTVNDMNPRLPVGRSRCFDIGTWGGCGVTCPAFVGGECGEPQEIEAKYIIEEHGVVDAIAIMKQYPCFKTDVEQINNESINENTN